MNMIILIMDHVLLWQPNQCVWLAIVVTVKYEFGRHGRLCGFGNLMDH